MNENALSEVLSIAFSGRLEQSFWRRSSQFKNGKNGSFFEVYFDKVQDCLEGGTLVDYERKDFMLRRLQDRYAAMSSLFRLVAGECGSSQKVPTLTRISFYFIRK